MASASLKAATSSGWNGLPFILRWNGMTIARCDPVRIELSRAEEGRNSAVDASARLAQDLFF